MANTDPTTYMTRYNANLARFAALWGDDRQAWERWFAARPAAIARAAAYSPSTREQYERACEELRVDAYSDDIIIRNRHDRRRTDAVQQPEHEAYIAYELAEAYRANNVDIAAAHAEFADAVARIEIPLACGNEVCEHPYCNRIDAALAVAARNTFE